MRHDNAVGGPPGGTLWYRPEGFTMKQIALMGSALTLAAILLPLSACKKEIKEPSCAPSPTGKGGPMCDVPTGKFMMGCNSVADTKCFSNENPYREVTVPSFKIDKYEVTAGEYKACVDAGGCTAALATNGCTYGMLGKESHPINCVNWDMAKEYCTWAGKRLPTEAEWEKAARGTDGRKYPWGNNGQDCDQTAKSESPRSNTGTAPVGSKPLGGGPYGSKDMIGSLCEWVEDDYHNPNTGTPVDGSAYVDAPRSSWRTQRGCSCPSNDSHHLRASFRRGLVSTFRIIANGFRCAQN